MIERAMDGSFRFLQGGLPMKLLSDLFARANGYRTYATALASMLAAGATIVGALSPTCGMALASAMLGASQIFQRLAAQDHALTLSDIQKDVTDLVNVIKPAEPSATVLFRPSEPVQQV
jgi:hypothetical protein